MELLENIAGYGVKLVDFRKIGNKESEYLEWYFDQEIAPLISPSIVGKRQPFPFLRNREIYALPCWRKRTVRKNWGSFPAAAASF